MAWPEICTPIHRSRRLRFLCLAGVVLLTIGIIVVVVLVTRDSSSSTDPSAIARQTSITPSFNATYLLADPLPASSGELNFNAADRARIARNFEASLNLSVQNILEIRSIILTTGIGNVLSSRRKRQVQCDQDVGGMTGPALTFDFNLINSTNSSCQTQACLYEKATEVYRQFQSARALSIDWGDKKTALLLCSLGILALEANGSRSEMTRPDANITTRRTVTPAQPTRAPTTTAGSTSAPTTATRSTEMPTSTAGSTRTPATEGSTRAPPITATIKATVTTSNTSTVQTTVVTSVSTASSNLTSDGTTRDVDVCIRKLPITQETAASHGMSLTSTLFYQDEHILVVIGASKFETTLDMQMGQRQIIINGVMVYNNCQRTLDVSIPMIASPSSSS